jgi:Acetyltransferase (GNAT) family
MRHWFHMIFLPVLLNPVYETLAMGLGTLRVSLASIPSRGLGRRMVQEAGNWLRQRGVWKVELLVRVDNPAAKDLHNRLDYRQTQTICFQKTLSGGRRDG